MYASPFSVLFLHKKELYPKFVHFKVGIKKTVGLNQKMALNSNSFEYYIFIIFKSYYEQEIINILE